VRPAALGSSALPGRGPATGIRATGSRARALRLQSCRLHCVFTLQVVEAGLALLETLLLSGAAREEAEEEVEAEAAAAGGGGGSAPRSAWPAAAVRVAAGACTSNSIEQAGVVRLLHRLKQARRDGPLLRYLQSHAQAEATLAMPPLLMLFMSPLDETGYIPLYLKQARQQGMLLSTTPSRRSRPTGRSCSQSSARRQRRPSGWPARGDRRPPRTLPPSGAGARLSTRRRRRAAAWRRRAAGASQRRSGVGWAARRERPPRRACSCWRGVCSCCTRPHRRSRRSWRNTCRPRNACCGQPPLVCWARRKNVPLPYFHLTFTLLYEFE
jgi:hypothetical protein